MIDDAQKPHWDYVHGLVLTSLEELNKQKKDSKYFNYIQKYADDLIDKGGMDKPIAGTSPQDTGGGGGSQKRKMNIGK
jgi:rhamnogalacturonyl hydrolase YesR